MGGVRGGQRQEHGGSCSFASFSLAPFMPNR